MRYLFILSMLLGVTQTRAQETAHDFSSLEHVIETVYEVISGPAGERDWDLFLSLYHKDATMGYTYIKEGSKEFVQFTPAEYQERHAPMFRDKGFYEQELGRDTHVFGGVAQVFSTYGFGFEKGNTDQKGVNCIQLVFEGDRWYITSLFWQPEQDELPLSAVERYSEH